MFMLTFLFSLALIIIFDKLDWYLKHFLLLAMDYFSKKGLVQSGPELIHLYNFEVSQKYYCVEDKYSYLI